MELVLARCELATHSKFSNIQFWSPIDTRPKFSAHDDNLFNYYFNLDPRDYSNYNTDNENMVLQ